MSIVICYYNNPDSTHIAALTQIFWYIKNTLYNNIVFCRELDIKLNLIGYTNADYGSVKDGRKPTNRELFFFEKRLISWSSK